MSDVDSNELADWLKREAVMNFHDHDPKFKLTGSTTHSDNGKSPQFQGYELDRAYATGFDAGATAVVAALTAFIQKERPSIAEIWRTLRQAENRHFTRGWQKEGKRT